MTKKQEYIDNKIMNFAERTRQEPSPATIIKWCNEFDEAQNRNMIQEAYVEGRKEIDQQIFRLQQALIEMDAEQQVYPRDWGFVGNARHIQEQLGYALNFIEDKK
jgi:hypothetical protein